MRKFDVTVKGEGFIVKVCNLVNGQRDGNWKYYPMIFDLHSRSIKIHEEEKISYSEEYDSLYDMWDDGKYESGLKCYDDDEFLWCDEDTYNNRFAQEDDKDNFMFRNVRNHVQNDLTHPFMIGYSNNTCYITCVYHIEIEDDEILNVEDVPMLKINDGFTFLKNGIIPDQIMYKNTVIDPVLTLVEERSKYFRSKPLYDYGHKEGVQHNYDGYDEFLENFTTFYYTNSECCDINLKDYRDDIERKLFNDWHEEYELPMKHKQL